MDGRVRDYISSRGYGAYFGHGLGHGVGLDIHEKPVLNKSNNAPLPAGAVVTIEPGVYLPGRGGVRIEDTVLVTGTGCEKLTSVTLGSGVQSIGSNCFTDCEALTDLTIKGSGVSVGTNAFNSCPLTNFTDWDKLGGEIGIGAFRYSGLRQVSLPPTVTSVAYVSFSGCKDLASVSLPDTLLKVDSKAFDGTKWYSDQKDGAVYLNKVFYDVKGQLPENTSLTVKDGTVSLADHALMGHQNLTQITLPLPLSPN